MLVHDIRNKYGGLKAHTVTTTTLKVLEVLLTSMASTRDPRLRARPPVRSAHRFHLCSAGTSEK